MPEESRAVHPGLQQMQRKIQSKSQLASPSPEVSQRELKSQFSIGPSQVYTSVLDSQNYKDVKFDLNTLLNAPERASRESLKVSEGQTGAETVENAQP